MFTVQGLAGYQFGSSTSSAIQMLQQQLTAYAQVAGKPDANPGGATGEVTDKTLSALMFVFGKIAPKLGTLGSVLGPALELAFSSQITKATAINLVKSNAGPITSAVSWLVSSAMGKDAPAPAPVENPPQGSATQASARDLLDRLRPSMATTAQFAPPSVTVWPAGTIKARSGQKWRIAVPKGTRVITQQLYGLNAVETEYEEISPVPVTYSVPVTEVPEKEFDQKPGVKKPWYKKWYWWAAIGGGVVVIGGTVYLVVRD